MNGDREWDFFDYFPIDLLNDDVTGRPRFRVEGVLPRKSFFVCEPEAVGISAADVAAILGAGSLREADTLRAERDRVGARVAGGPGQRRAGAASGRAPGVGHGRGTSAARVRSRQTACKPCTSSDY